jgi:mannose-6-phosphate isomerase-like protein (cupin superfamily)
VCGDDETGVRPRIREQAGRGEAAVVTAAEDNGFHIEAGLGVSSGTLLHRQPELRDLSVETIIPGPDGSPAEFLFGAVDLRPGQGLPLHSHSHAETVFVVDGRVQVQRGRAIAEVTGPGAAYFPAGVAHGVREQGGAAARVLICYQDARPGWEVTSELEEGRDQSRWPNPNIIRGTDPLYRWALVEDYESWLAVEPTKGWTGKMRYLLSPDRGADDVVAGTGLTAPNVHYTVHRHEPAELYYVLSGSGCIYVGTEAYPVLEGSTVYVPPSQSHGIDTFESHLKTCWVYGLARCGADWTWEALEPIYNVPRHRS